ncbi:hypothetical protein AJ80_07977 [Polytolypa hystricis UAMH7299]|uniref:T6SS Phospholipase effector Tle1-like catalytic domain-containing protein n=1 Tax=Polytolypa hystricis (strain UAMH7299) TaxID=1447883 RepID=A0A2B7XG48_POLH7|nr:hypothetical protein AJ80_07977 [Polytolypa hystricis UAMH7299]
MSHYGPVTPPKTFVLCFDGTGNKFAGDESDSNVLKIFRMLDRSQGGQFHYYQPGIGTYVTTTSLTHTSIVSRIKSSYLKAKDSAIGSSFDHHVMGGYKFLMRYYSPGDEIYFFGFSRGAYTARFLAEMLDYVGLLTAGNEELVRFAWKTFAKWQQRRSGDSEEDRVEKKKLFRFMKAFRETFSRPVQRIRFLGLFDTVNSVPKFESAWMQRSKFPYTARSSAKVIRHAVGIDERRAKFRQDLISECKPHHRPAAHNHALEWTYRHLHRRADRREGIIPKIVLPGEGIQTEDGENGTTRGANASGTTHHNNPEPDEEELERYRPTVHHQWEGRLNLPVPKANASAEDLCSVASFAQSNLSIAVSDHSDDSTQDIEEIWFPGGHADIGGGWQLMPGETWPLSHAPLVWMVHEAQRAGLRFDPRKLKQFECAEEYEGEVTPIQERRPSVRHPNLDVASPSEKETNGVHQSPSSQNFHNALYTSACEGQMHDCLKYNHGLPITSVLTWKLMEYLPFRRMDLQEDGSWKPIRWPLPCGEVRDIPANARIHVSALRRMNANPKYRPGNLIVGGGGRGVRKAPEHLGIGEWVLFKDGGNPVKETYIRKSMSKKSEKECAH